MRKTRLTPIAANTFAIRVDSYQNGEMTGVVSGALLSQPLEFQSLTQLILMLDNILDLNEEDDIIPAAAPVLDFAPTLELEIMFRQNHSWQGRLRWIEGGKEASFRSVLELLVIIDTIFAP